MAWVVPSFFALPLVALGRVQVTADSAHSAGFARDGATAGAGTFAFVVLAIYLAGVAIVAARTLIAWRRLRRDVTTTAEVDRELTQFVAGALPARRWRRAPRVIVSRTADVPMTWGWLQSRDRGAERVERSVERRHSSAWR